MDTGPAAPPLPVGPDLRNGSDLSGYLDIMQLDGWQVNLYRVLVKGANIFADRQLVAHHPSRPGVVSHVGTVQCNGHPSLDICPEEPRNKAGVDPNMVIEAWWKDEGRSVGINPILLIERIGVRTTRGDD